MNHLGERIQALRKQLGISQVDLAKKIKVSKSMINRYENRGVQPPADVLNKIAGMLNTSVDFLINGNKDEKAKATLKNSELLQKFKEVDAMPEKEQNMLLHYINIYLRDFKARQTYVV